MRRATVQVRNVTRVCLDGALKKALQGAGQLPEEQPLPQHARGKGGLSHEGPGEQSSFGQHPPQDKSQSSHSAGKLETVHAS